MPGELVGCTTQKGGSILVPLLPSAPREHPFVKSPGWISLADWLELCPECPDVQAPGRWGTAGVRCLPRGWALLGRLDCASPSTAGLLAGWVGSSGADPPCAAAPGPPLPAVCCHWGPSGASMATEPWTVLPKNVSISCVWSWAGCVERVAVTEEGQEEERKCLQESPSPRPCSIFLNSRDFIVLDACQKSWLIKKWCLEGELINWTKVLSNSCILFGLDGSLSPEVTLRGRRCTCRAEKAMEGCVCRACPQVSLQDPSLWVESLP